MSSFATRDVLDEVGEERVLARHRALERLLCAAQSHRRRMPEMIWRIIDELEKTK